MAWTVYILRCADKTLYTGITNNLDARMARHAEGKGAKYTRGRAPYELVFSELHATKGDALRRELEIKALSKIRKLSLCMGLQS